MSNKCKIKKEKPSLVAEPDRIQLGHSTEPSEPFRAGKVETNRNDSPKTERPDVELKPLEVADIQETEPRTYKLMRPSKIAPGQVIEEDVDFETWVVEILKNINGTINTLAKKMNMQRVPTSLLNRFKRN